MQSRRIVFVKGMDELFLFLVEIPLELKNNNSVCRFSFWRKAMLCEEKNMDFQDLDMLVVTCINVLGIRNNM